MRFIIRHDKRDKKSQEPCLEERQIKRRRRNKRGSLDLSIEKVSFGVPDKSMMENLQSAPRVSEKWASEQARAILAVDNIRATPEGDKLIQAIENGEMSHEEAVQIILNRAYEYASRQ